MASQTTISSGTTKDLTEKKFRIEKTISNDFLLLKKHLNKDLEFIKSQKKKICRYNDYNF
jgi:hypothetical protein